MYGGTGKLWQPVKIGKLPRILSLLIVCGAAHGRVSGHCLGAVCQTLAVAAGWLKRPSCGISLLPLHRGCLAGGGAYSCLFLIKSLRCKRCLAMQEEGGLSLTRFHRSSFCHAVSEVE